MPSQKLRLEAEMRDNASPAVRKLRQELAALQAQTADLRAVGKLNKEIATLRKESGELRATPGMKAFGSWVGEATGKTAGFLGSISNLPSILGAVGVGGLAAGESVAALASEMRRLGDQSLALKELSRQTGISLDFVNRWSHAGEHFGVTGDAMRSMLDRFAGQIPDFNRGVGSMYKEFSLWPDVVRKMQSESPAAALMDAFEQIEEVGRVKGPEVQKQMLEAMGLGADAEKLFAERLAGLRNQLNKPWAGPSQDLTKQALALRDATIEINNDFERLENVVAPGFLKILRGGIEGVDLIVKGWVWEFQKIADIIGYLGKSSEAGAKAFENTEKRAVPPAPIAPPAIQPPTKLGEPPFRLEKKVSYDGSGFGGLLQNASYTTGGTGSGTMEGQIAEGSKAGVLQAFREWAIQSDISKAAGGFTNASYGDSGGGGFGAGTGGRVGAAFGGGGVGNLDAGTGAFPAGSSIEQVRQYIRAKASALGIDPNIAERVARSEGLNKSLGAGGDGGTSDGPFQLHVGGGLGDAYERQFHHSIHDKRYWKDQVDFALGQARKGGWGPWHGWHGPANAGIGIKPDSSALDALNKSGDASAISGSASNGSSYPGHIAGQLKIGDSSYRFGSGGVRGSSSIPFGDHEITPNSVGPWGRSVGALGIANEHIWDKALGRMREGIELHMGHSANLITEGCVAFERSQWPKVKSQVLSMIREHGHAYLHVGPNGASITPRRADDPALSASRQGAPRRADGDLSPGARDRGERDSDHSLTIHVRDPGGHIRATHLERKGPMRVEMPNRWKTGQSPLIAT